MNHAPALPVSARGSFSLGAHFCLHVSPAAWRLAGSHTMPWGPEPMPRLPRTLSTVLGSWGTPASTRQENLPRNCAQVKIVIVLLKKEKKLKMRARLLIYREAHIVPGRNLEVLSGLTPPNPDFPGGTRKERVLGFERKPPTGQVRHGTEDQAGQWEVTRPTWPQPRAGVCWRPASPPVAVWDVQGGSPSWANLPPGGHRSLTWALVTLSFLL